MSRPSRPVLAALATTALVAASLSIGTGAFAATPDPSDPFGTSTPQKRIAPAKTTPLSESAERNLQTTAAVTSADGFSSALALTSYFPSAEFDTTAAGTQPGEPLTAIAGYTLRRTVWAKWTAPVSGVVTVSTNTGNSADDTILKAYTGTSLTALKQVGLGDEAFYPVAGMTTTGSYTANAVILSLKVTKGTTYRFQIGSAKDPDTTVVPAGFASVFLQIDGARYLPSNDDLASASTLSLGTAASTTKSVLMNGATLESWEPTDTNIPADTSGDVTYTRSGSVWYKWTPPANGSLTVSACGSFLNTTAVAVYGANFPGFGTNYGELASFGSDAQGNDCGSIFSDGGTVTFAFTAKTTYEIQLSNVAPSFPAQLATVTFDVTYSSPFITSVSPSSGSRNGGNTITITGQNFTVDGAPTVKFGATSGTVTSYTATQIKVKVPKRSSAGTVSLNVTSGSAPTAVSSYTYK